MRFVMRVLRLSPVKAVVVRIVVPVLDLLLAPVTAVAAVLMLAVRRVGVYRLPVSRWVLGRIGVFPIRDHYYEPLFNPAHLTRPLHEDRDLPGIDLNVDGQLALLERFAYQEELKVLPRARLTELGYYYDNPNFGPGDAEYLYSIIRLMRPSAIVEVGCGLSTLLTVSAVSANRLENSSYRCRHVCIEPYEMPWLERLPDVEVIRLRLEDVDLELFLQLKRGDILFIDSSHVVRPQGDVVCAYLRILPRLAPGVLIHVHDIFTPRDYPEEWLVHEVRLWNEQYLLEAFLTLNPAFRVIGAVNFLSRHHWQRISQKCPLLATNRLPCPPASFWLERI